MKTRHIIAIGLLSALAVTVLGLAIHNGKTKTKTFQTKAEIQITDLTNTEWEFNENFAPSLNENTTWSIEFTSNNTNFYSLKYFTDNNSGNLAYGIGKVNTYVHNTTGWIDDNYRTITITGGTQVDSTTLINFLYNNATLLDPATAWYDEGFADGQQLGQAQGYQTGYTAGETAGYQTGYTAGQTAGYQTGYTAGETAGETAGYETGYTAGQSAGYNTGYQAGLSAVAEQAFQEGYAQGYGIGYNDSEAFNHPIALQPLLLNILTMPFTFISQAFDVTLWPGTAYEFNFANFIKGMITIATIMFIIKLFTSGFSIIGNYTNNINKEAKMRSDNRKSKQAWKSQKIAQKGAKQANNE